MKMKSSETKAMTTCRCFSTRQQWQRRWGPLHPVPMNWYTKPTSRF